MFVLTRGRDCWSWTASSFEGRMSFAMIDPVIGD